MIREQIENMLNIKGKKLQDLPSVEEEFGSGSVDIGSIISHKKGLQDQDDFWSSILEDEGRLHKRTFCYNENICF